MKMSVYKDETQIILQIYFMDSKIYFLLIWQPYLISHSCTNQQRLGMLKPTSPVILANESV